MLYISDDDAFAGITNWILHHRHHNTSLPARQQRFAATIPLLKRRKLQEYSSVTYRTKKIAG